MLSAFDLTFKTKLVIDMHVYCRNQNFRLVQSSKFGKDCPMTLVSKNFDNTEIDEATFLDTLVSGYNLIVNTVTHELLSTKDPLLNIL